MELQQAAIVDASSGSRIRDIDGNWRFDLSGAYGVNVFGFDFYKLCMREGTDAVADLGPVLGPYHPLVRDNSQRIAAIAGLDDVSFHMSGTEAVMQAVRLARYHTGRSHLVRFCGAYHGWWDGVQPGIGNNRRVNDVYTLAEMSKRTLRVLASRRDIACVLVNPLQALHPNADAPGDAALVNSRQRAAFDRDRYTQWLQDLRRVCSERGIVLIIDEVLTGFRLGRGGAQEYFGVRADMVTYGKTLGGGFPVGVLCGTRELMQRYREHAPADVSFARGTFNSHPAVMGAMNSFLRRLDSSELRAIHADADALWSRRFASLNDALAEAQLPVSLAHLHSVATVRYHRASRYNWMLQFYLRHHGLELSWVGTGRLIMYLGMPDADFDEIRRLFVVACADMHADGWWWQSAQLTERSIRARLLREMLAARFSRRGGTREVLPEPTTRVGG